jgi:outer membrane protein OmpA-like peptidoglycan-associated protein
MLIGVTLVALAASAGCATKGYVRSQVGDLRQETDDKNAALRADLEQVRGDGARALAAAGDAGALADQSRLLALGNVDFREAARFQVYFAFNSAELDEAAKASLDQAAGELEKNPQYLAELYGFCDPRGSEAYNLQLGQRRASAVLRYLASRAPAQLPRYNAISFGETPPDMERAAWGDEYTQQRQVLLVLAERIPASEKRETLTQTTE